MPTISLSINAPNKQLALTKSISASGDQNIENVEETEEIALEEQPIMSESVIDETPKLSSRQPAQNYFSNEGQQQIVCSPTLVTTFKSPTGPQEPKILEESNSHLDMFDHDPYF